MRVRKQETLDYRNKWIHVLNMHEKQLRHIDIVWRGIKNLGYGPRKKDAVRTYLSMVRDLEDFENLSKMPLRFRTTPENMRLMKLRGESELVRQPIETYRSGLVKIKNSDVYFGNMSEAAKALGMTFYGVKNAMEKGEKTKNGFYLVPATVEEYENNFW